MAGLEVGDYQKELRELLVFDESNDGLIVGPITESGLITENGRILVHK